MTSFLSSALAKCKIEDIDFIAILQIDSFGVLRLCRHKSSGSIFSARCLSKSSACTFSHTEHVQTERTFLSQVTHPFLNPSIATLQDSKYVYILSKFPAGGELFSHLASAGFFSEEVTRFYIGSMVLFLECLHGKGYVFRNIKPESLLIDSEGYLCITDLCFLKHVSKTSMTWTMCGTPDYFAPEVILNQGHNTAADWWSLGVLMFELLVGAPPFFSEDRMTVYKQALSGKVAYPSHVSRFARHLISQFLQTAPSKRIGSLRGGVVDIKSHPFFKDFDWEALETRKMKCPMVFELEGPKDTQHYGQYEESEVEFPNFELSTVQQSAFEGF